MGSSSYIRVSTFEQNPERQLDQVPFDRTFRDKASGKENRRPELEAMIAFAHDGDVVVVHSIDRLARNLDDQSVSAARAMRWTVRMCSMPPWSMWARGLRPSRAGWVLGRVSQPLYAVKDNLSRFGSIICRISKVKLAIQGPEAHDLEA